MPAKTLLDFSLLLRELASDAVGRIGARNPRLTLRLLRALERAGCHGAGWALLVLEISLDARDRTPTPPRHSYIGPLLALGARELDEPACLDSACEVVPAAELDELEPVPAELDAPAELEPVLVFELDYRHCRGAWADRDDSSTRYTPHPETGLCTFACSWQDARCDESWFGDPRCFPAHGVRLAGLCAELGGACHKALTSDVAYCEAR